MTEISGVLIFFLIIMLLILYILFEGYKELDEMEQRIKNLEGKTVARDDFMRNIILKDINKEEEK